MPLGTNINVGYTLINLNEMNRDLAIQKIKSIINEYFEGSYQELANTNDEKLSELIFSIETPVFNSHDQKLKFFIELEQLFAKTEEYKPYFCDYKEGGCK